MDIVWIRCVLTLEPVSFVSLCLVRKRYWGGKYNLSGTVKMSRLCHFIAFFSFGNSWVTKLPRNYMRPFLQVGKCNVLHGRGVLFKGSFDYNFFVLFCLLKLIPPWGDPWCFAVLQVTCRWGYRSSLVLTEFALVYCIWTAPHLWVTWRNSPVSIENHM